MFFPQFQLQSENHSRPKRPLENCLSDSPALLYSEVKHAFRNHLRQIKAYLKCTKTSKGKEPKDLSGNQLLRLVDFNFPYIFQKSQHNVSSPALHQFTFMYAHFQGTVGRQKHWIPGAQREKKVTVMRHRPDQRKTLRSQEGF